MAEFELERGADARKVPLRLLFVQADERPAVEEEDAQVVMSFPHLVLRELIAFLALLLFLVAISLLFDAPLEELANPDRTPNPAKAPWYFLGLQELLHYYPPVVAGVLLPGLIVGCLMIIPYFVVNLERAPLWASGRVTKVIAILLGSVGLVAVLACSGAHPLWPAIVPTILIALLMVLPGLLGTGTRTLAWIGSRSLPFWIFTWFLAVGLALTVVGIFFRGPGWTLTLPWRDGIYY
ncbi:MAG: hypothetical protein HY815_31870 [Candidatus Riflebacteria bacterium]|nr:hypothetical protein [Candidatus Riflebacteria bacterium]